MKAIDEDAFTELHNAICAIGTPGEDIEDNAMFIRNWFANMAEQPNQAFRYVTPKRFVFGWGMPNMSAGLTTWR